MKRFALSLLLFSMSLITLSAQSNSVFIGANGGVNLSKLKYTEDLQELYPNSKAILGLNGGATLGIELSGFTLTTGIQYVQKGGEYSTDNFIQDENVAFFKGREKLHFLSVPMHVGYRKYFSDKFALSLAIGPSLNFGLEGKLDETTEFFGTDDVKVENYEVAFGNGVNEDYKGVQVGFQVSPGMIFVLNENAKLTFNVTWDAGLNDSFNPRYKDANTFFDTTSGNQINQSTIFTVGYEYHFNFGDRY